jgi:O-Antigen ligase
MLVSFFSSSVGDKSDLPITTYGNGAIILYGLVLIIEMLRHRCRASGWLITLASIYSLGVLIVSLIRWNEIASELPRAMITSIAIWNALVLGSCMGALNKTVIYSFARLMLVFGVVATTFSMITGLGAISSLQGIEIGRANRLWVNSFSIVDPMCMFGAGWYICSEKFIPTTSKSRKINVFLCICAFVILVYTSTRSFYIELVFFLAFVAISRFAKHIKLILLPLFMSIVIVVALSAQTMDLSFLNVGDVLYKLGFIGNNGYVNKSESRIKLHEFLIEKAMSSPVIGIGMNSVKEETSRLPSSQDSISDAVAKTEYGYYLHIAAFGYLVAAPLYIIFFLGGALLPFFNLLILPKQVIQQTAPIHAMSVCSFLAGFNGYYGQATAVNQFISLVFIGIATSLDQRSSYPYPSILNEDQHRINNSLNVKV